MSSAIRVGLEIMSRMPRAILREWRGGRDRAIRDALEFAGAPHMNHEVADGLLAAPLRAGLLRAGLLGGPHLCLPYFSAEACAPGPGTFDAPFMDPARPRPWVRRHPYVLYSETALTASSTTITGSVTDYSNTTGLPFYITHLMLSMDGHDAIAPLRVDPTYSLRLTPSTGKPWMSATKVPAAALMSYRTQWGPAQNSLPLCVWEMAGQYLVDARGGFELWAENPSSAGAIRADLTLVCYKRDEQGTIRIFTDTQTLAASATASGFAAGNFQGDGDADFAIHQIVMSAGPGDWHAGAFATAPRYFIRQAGANFAFTAKAAMAPALDNMPGGTLGSYLRLATPQLLVPNGQMTIEFTENDGVARTANVGLMGYLQEVAAAGNGGAEA